MTAAGVGPFVAAGGAVWIVAAGAWIVLLAVVILALWRAARRPASSQDTYCDWADQRLDELARARSDCRRRDVVAGVSQIGDQADRVWTDRP